MVAVANAQSMSIGWRERDVTDSTPQARKQIARSPVCLLSTTPLHLFTLCLCLCFLIDCLFLYKFGVFRFFYFFYYHWVKIKACFVKSFYLTGPGRAKVALPNSYISCLGWGRSLYRKQVVNFTSVVVWNKDWNNFENNLRNTLI